jgi:ABC-type cobalt transport system substrate-binding protein
MMFNKITCFLLIITYHILVYFSTFHEAEAHEDKDKGNNYKCTSTYYKPAYKPIYVASTEYMTFTRPSIRLRD